MSTTSTRMSDTVAQTVADAIALHAMGEAVRYDVGLTFVPDQSGQPSPIYGVVLTMPSGALGQRLTSLVLLPPEDVDKSAEITKAVKDSLEKMRQARTEMLNVARGQNPLPDLSLGRLDRMAGVGRDR